MIAAVAAIGFVIGMAGTLAPAGQPIAWYPLDGNALDLSGYGNNGTVTGTAPAADRFGVANKAYYFNGSSCISIPDCSLLNMTGDFTLSTWIKLDTSISYQRDVFSNMAETSPHWGYQLSVSDNNTLRLMSGDKSVFASTPILGQGWLYVVATLEGTTGKIYANGKLVGQGQIAPAVYSDLSPSPQVIGAASTKSYYFWPGYIDDVRIYDYALSPDEIQTLYQAPEPASLSLLALGGLAMLRRRH